jgi:hypothetical protein
MRKPKRNERCQTIVKIGDPIEQIEIVSFRYTGTKWVISGCERFVPYEQAAN